MANFERPVLGCIDDKFLEVTNTTRLKALDEIYKIYTYGLLGEKNTLLHLLTPIWKRWKAFLANVIRAKNTTPEKKPADRGNAARPTLLHLWNPIEKP